jgi:hypothetical protein
VQKYLESVIARGRAWRDDLEAMLVARNKMVLLSYYFYHRIPLHFATVFIFL